MAKNTHTVAAQVLDVIPAVMRTIRKNFRAQRDPDLTLPEFRALAFINRNSGCALNEVAEHVGFEAPSASKLVEQLVQRGLVKRAADPSDRRRVRLQLSPRGQRSINTAIEHTRHFLAERLTQLSEADGLTVMQAMQILKGAFSAESEKEQTERE